MEAIRGLYKKTRKEGTLFGFSVCTEIKVLLVSSYLRKAGALIVVLSVISITQKLKAMATHRFYKETILSNEKSKLSFEKSANKLELEFEHIICVQARLVFISASPFQN